MHEQDKYTIENLASFAHRFETILSETFLDLEDFGPKQHIRAERTRKLVEKYKNSDIHCDN